MSGKPVRYYWDTCVFLKALKQEQDNPGDSDLLASVNQIWNGLDEGRFVIVSSTVMLVEVEMNRSEYHDDMKDKFFRFMRGQNIRLISLNRQIAKLASKLRGEPWPSRRKLSVPDAVHLATAVASGVDVFHTMDKGARSRDQGLLGLDACQQLEDIIGKRIKIEKPVSSTPRLGF